MIAESAGENLKCADMFLILIIYLYLVRSFPPFVNNN